MEKDRTAREEEAPPSERGEASAPQGGGPSDEGRVERLLRFPKEEIRLPELVERFG